MENSEISEQFKYSFWLKTNKNSTFLRIVHGSVHMHESSYLVIHFNAQKILALLLNPETLRVEKKHTFDTESCPTLDTHFIHNKSIYVNQRIFLFQNCSAKEPTHIFVADIQSWVVYPIKNVDSRPQEFRINYSVNLNLLKIVFFGGLNENMQPINTLETFDITTYNWEKIVVKGPSPQPRHSHTAQIVDNKLIVIGGTNKSDLFIKDQSYFDIWIFDFTDKIWLTYNPTGQLPAYMAYTYSAVLYPSNQIILFCSDAKDQDLQSCLLDLNKYEFSQLSVQTSKPKIKYSSGFLYNYKLQQCLFFGGFNPNKPDPECISNEIETLQMFENNDSKLFQSLELYNNEKYQSQQQLSEQGQQIQSSQQKQLVQQQSQQEQILHQQDMQVQDDHQLIQTQNQQLLQQLDSQQPSTELVTDNANQLQDEEKKQQPIQSKYGDDLEDEITFEELLEKEKQAEAKEKSKQIQKRQNKKKKKKVLQSSKSGLDNSQQ